jgi:hypothetical protein
MAVHHTVMDGHAPSVYWIQSFHAHKTISTVTGPVIWVLYIHLVRAKVASPINNTQQLLHFQTARPAITTVVMYMHRPLG